jgi:hypothetical protein
MTANNLMSDLRKFAIHNFRIITEDLELNPDQDIEFNSNFFQVLLYELFECFDISVKYEISQIFLNLTCDSAIVNENLLDVDYFNKILILTYCEKLPLISNLILMMGNIIIHNELEDVDNLILNVPIVNRIKEILTCEDLKKEKDTNEFEKLRTNSLWLLENVVRKTNVERYIKVSLVFFAVNFIIFF